MKLTFYKYPVNAEQGLSWHRPLEFRLPPAKLLIK